jgi:peptide/nickel transport system permease protein
VLFNVVGGSPAQVILGKNATAESIAAFNHKYGYDLPLPEQFVKFCGDLTKGDFGVSSSEADEPVLNILKRGVGPSLSLTVPILLGGTLSGIMLAMFCAAWHSRAFDNAVMIGSTVLMSVNYVVWVLAGQFIFAFKLKLFPVWGYENAFYLVLPVLIGVVCGLGADVRFFRTAILDEIYKPYVRTARMKGLPECRILFGHVLRNSLIPIVTYVSLSIPYLFTGSLMLESFFGIPGLGSVSINAIHSSDMAVVRAVVVLGALLYQGVNLATDLLYAWLDPRVRLD